MLRCLAPGIAGVRASEFDARALEREGERDSVYIGGKERARA